MIVSGLRFFQGCLLFTVKLLTLSDALARFYRMKSAAEPQDCLGTLGSHHSGKGTFLLEDQTLLRPVQHQHRLTRTRDDPYSRVSYE